MHPVTVISIVFCVLVTILGVIALIDDRFRNS